jgi:competence protein ComEA
LKKLKNFIQNYFNFSEREASGFIVVMLLVVGFLAVPFIINSLRELPVYDYKKDMATLDSLQQIANQESAANPVNSYKTKTAEATEKIPLQPFTFDPNTVTESELVQMNIPPKMASNWIKYTNAGGKFYKVDDLQKIYNLTPTMYEALKPFITLEKKTYVDKQTAYKPFEKKAQKAIAEFDINKADTTALIQIKGIGSKLAARIVKYRDKLGGIISKNQYYEIYGLDSLVCENLILKTFIEKDYTPHKIKIKTVTIADLEIHPYLNKKEATLLYNYIQQHKNITEPTELLQMKALDSKKIYQILPYLDFAL